MARVRRLVPGLMMGALSLGIITSLTHHLFYQSLNGQIVQNGVQQAWFQRIGTGLAFITKTLLTSAATIAYAQILWFTLRSRPVTVNGLDAFFGVLHDAWGFTDSQLWTQGPLLVLVASICWREKLLYLDISKCSDASGYIINQNSAKTTRTLPFIAIVTPATLTIELATQPNQTLHNVTIPSIDYSIGSNGRLERSWASWAVGVMGRYESPSFGLTRLMAAVAAQGSILSVPAPFANSSYVMTFYGPLLTCGPPSFDNSMLQSDIANILNQKNASDGLFDFIAFVPVWQSGNDSLLEPSLFGFNQTTSATLLSISTYDTVSTDHARLFVTAPMGYPVAPNATSECALFNASYTVNFTFSNGQQSFTVVNKTRINGVAVGTGVVGCDSLVQCMGPWVPYIAMLHALGQMLVGFVQSIPDGFMIATSTQITNTVLMDTVEMQAMLQLTNQAQSTPVLSKIMAMPEAIEEFFLNATLSIFGYAGLLQNSTQASRIPVTAYSPQTAYHYSAGHLYMAYGTGIFVTIIVISAGFVCIWTSNYAYGTTFSTILRTTRNSDLDSVVSTDQTSGTVPMSKQLGRTKLVLQRVTTKGEVKTTFTVAGGGSGVELLPAEHVHSGYRQQDSRDETSLLAESTHPRLGSFSWEAVPGGTVNSQMMVDMDNV